MKITLMDNGPDKPPTVMGGDPPKGRGNQPPSEVTAVTYDTPAGTSTAALRPGAETAPTLRYRPHVREVSRRIADLADQLDQADEALSMTNEGSEAFMRAKEQRDALEMAYKQANADMNLLVNDKASATDMEAMAGRYGWKYGTAK